MYSYVCGSCGEQHDQLISYANRESPVTCPECGEQATYVVSAPSIRTSDSASRVDNAKPAWYENWKAASKIRKEALNLPENKREEHRKEVKARKENVNF